MQNDLDDITELERILKDRSENLIPTKRFGDPGTTIETTAFISEDIMIEKISNTKQWSVLGDGNFVACGETKQILPPGYYCFRRAPQIGLYISSIPVKTEGLIRFPNLASDKVIEEIQKFWDMEEAFKANKLTYKRGIILWGPPGSGKSSVIQILLSDVIKRGGIAIQFQEPHMFEEGLIMVRKIQKETPIIVLMEDIDEILDNYDESSVLNILDGIFKLHKIVFLATTNYPEKLGARIINRPSRFDKRFKIGHPDAESRKIYIEHLISYTKTKIDVEKWVRDSEDFSFAHIRELFIAVVIMDNKYEEALETIASMKEKVYSSPEESFTQRKAGF